MAKTEVQLSFRTMNELKERLEAQAKREDRSVAYVIREAVEEYLQRKEKELES